MVSNLTEVDAQDDEDEIGMAQDEEGDEKVETVDPVISNVMIPPMTIAGSCLEMQRYTVPQATISSVEIDTDLSTVFNTLNVTYT
jgi:hypothetical protein